MFNGKKTKIGAVLLILAGCIYIGGLYDPILYVIGEGVAMMGVGLAIIGMHSRISRGLFNIHDGKIMYGSARTQPTDLVGG